nr:serine hydrolase [Nostoc sp. ChiSLP03a]MDZ8212587.1 serine hydrolase [Nostoc sp. ChiSLP03a]
MRKISVAKVGIIAATSFLLGACAQAADSKDQSQFEQIVSEVIRPIMEENNVPGMAVAVTVQGKRYFFNYGVASKESAQKVTQDTIFEIGSVSKTFTATLASYAQVSGTLSLLDNASKYLPALADSSFNKISLLNLGTYTAGGLPLQFPDNVNNQQEIDCLL